MLYQKITLLEASDLALRDPVMYQLIWLLGEDQEEMQLVDSIIGTSRRNSYIVKAAIYSQAATLPL